MRSYVAPCGVRWLRKRTASFTLLDGTGANRIFSSPKIFDPFLTRPMVTWGLKARSSTAKPSLLRFASISLFSALRRSVSPPMPSQMTRGRWRPGKAPIFSRVIPKDGVCSQRGLTAPLIRLTSEVGIDPKKCKVKCSSPGLIHRTVGNLEFRSSRKGVMSA